MQQSGIQVPESRFLRAVSGTLKRNLFIKKEEEGVQAGILYPGAGDSTIAIPAFESRNFLRTCGLCDRTAGVESASGRLLERVRDITF